MSSLISHFPVFFVCLVGALPLPGNLQKALALPRNGRCELDMLEVVYWYWAVITLTPTASFSDLLQALAKLMDNTSVSVPRNLFFFRKIF